MIYSGLLFGPPCILSKYVCVHALNVPICLELSSADTERALISNYSLQQTCSVRASPFYTACGHGYKDEFFSLHSMQWRACRAANDSSSLMHA